MSWLTGYTYRKRITITGQAGAGNNYQVKLQIGNVSGGDFNLSGHAASFPNDIRFTSNNGSIQLDYWIENVATAPITAWIKVADSLNSNVDIYCYYGRASDTTTSNGRNTFIVFDDFATGSSEQWTMSNVTADRTTNHRLNISGVTGTTSAYLDKGTDIGDFEFLYTYTRTSTGFGQGFGTGIGNTITNDFDSQNAGVGGFDHLGGAFTQFKYLRVKYAGIDYGTYTTAGANNTLYYARLTRFGNIYNITIYSDAARTIAVWTLSTTRSGLTGLRYIYGVATLIDKSVATTGWIKDIIIRKYVSPEPTFYTTDTEELGMTATAMSISQSETPCRTGICTITANVTWQNLGSSNITFRPTIIIDGTTYVQAASDITILPYPNTNFSTITTPTLAVGTHSICPYPN